MAYVSNQDKKSINELGQDLLITLNSGTIGTVTNITYSNAGSIIPSIKGMKYFRAISNLVAEVECSFAKTSYALNGIGELVQNKNIVVGYDDIWYETDNNDINSAQIRLVWPTSIFDSISICFQFVNDIPAQLTFE